MKRALEVNLEKERDRIRKWHKDHPEKIKELSRKYRESKPFQILVSQKRIRSNKKGLDFDLDIEYLRDLWDECGGICSMTGVKLNMRGKKSKTNDPFVMSIDRMDPKKGYVKGNVRIVCRWYNTTRSNYSDEFTLEMCQQVIGQAITISG